jgi:hypothetical protein
MINSALGPKLSLQSTVIIIVYCVIAAIIFALYIIVVFIGERQRTRRLRVWKEISRELGVKISAREKFLSFRIDGSGARRSEIPDLPPGYYRSRRV